LAEAFLFLSEGFLLWSEDVHYQTAFGKFARRGRFCNWLGFVLTQLRGLPGLTEALLSLLELRVKLRVLLHNPVMALSESR